MTTACPNNAPCVPCPDEQPISNLSAEAPDVAQVWTVIYPYDGGRPGPTNRPPITGPAKVINTDIGQPPVPPGVPEEPPVRPPPDIITPPTGDPTPDQVPNQAMLVPVRCPGGGGTYYVRVAAGIFYARTQQEADAAVQSMAKNFGQGAKVCMDNSNMPFCYDSIVNEYLYLSGGNPPFTWNVIGGGLPPGLALGVDPNQSDVGIVSGVPTVPGNGFIQFQIFDALTNFLIKTVTWQCMGIVTGMILPDAPVGDFYSVTLVAAGGTGNYDFSLDAGGLPDGLTLHTDGTIDGIPTNADPAFFTVRVTDGNFDCLKDFSLNAIY